MDANERRSILERSQQLEPWWFRFELEGFGFGGQVPRDTEKTELFRKWAVSLGKPLKTILEFGSHEGSHSLQLANLPGVEKVIGLEAREANLERARFVKTIFGADKVEFHQCNLEVFDPGAWYPCDAVFCAGILYHLPRPWEFIPQISALCKSYLFLDTHYANEPIDRVEGYRGQWTGEGSDPLSGMSKQSFWLSFKDLMRILMDNQFLVRFVCDYEQFPKGARAFIFAEKTNLVGYSRIA